MRRTIGLTVALAAAVTALGSGCGSVASRSAAGDAGGNTSNGKQLFVERCGSCHALADAGTQGQVGPNLDHAFDDIRAEDGFGESTIRSVVRGQIAYPVEDPPTGAPGMPADLVTGQDAEDVAAYVAAVAGVPGAGGEGGGGVEATDGKEIFTAAGCGSCHALADAGTQGQIGPNLDEASPDEALVVDRVTNGMGAMPAFADQLTEEQIQAVAEYVAGATG